MQITLADSSAPFILRAFAASFSSKLEQLEARIKKSDMKSRGEPPTGLIYSQWALKPANEKPVRARRSVTALSPRLLARSPWRGLSSWREEQYPWISVTDRFLGASWTIRPAWSIDARAPSLKWSSYLFLCLLFSREQARANTSNATSEWVKWARGPFAGKGRANHDIQRELEVSLSR